MEPRFSIITCSIDSQKFERYRDMLSRQFHASYELIRIGDASSLCEGYNRGAQQAQADLLIFCHDDIAFLNRDFALRLEHLLERFHVIGVAGTTQLVAGKWLNAGFPFLHGHIAHGDPDEASLRYVHYGCGQDAATVAQIQALDGVFMAMRAPVWQALRFDEATFDGFHLYDLDFSFRAFLAGYQLGVDYGLQLVHFSSGNYDAKWNRYKYLFRKKFKAQLKQVQNTGLPFYISQDVPSLECCAQLMQHAVSQVAVSLDGEEQRQHLLKLGVEDLYHLSELVAFWFVPTALAEQRIEGSELCDLIWRCSCHGAVVHLKGSVAGLDRFEKDLEMLEVGVGTPRMLKVARHHQVPAQALYRIVKHEEC